MWQGIVCEGDEREGGRVLCVKGMSVNVAGCGV